MPHRKNRMKKQSRFSKIKGKPLLRQLKDPIETSAKETNNLRRTEKLQQTDIDKEKEIILEDTQEEEEKRNEISMRKKMEELLSKLPKQDKLRNIMDEKKKMKNDNKMKSTPKVNTPENLVDRS